MSKMREAFERWASEVPTHRKDADRFPFEAGYQAAISDVRAAGSVGRVAIDTYPFVADTYKLLEDV